MTYPNQPQPRYETSTVEAVSRLRDAFADFRTRGDAACGIGGFYKRAHYHRIVVLQYRGIHQSIGSRGDDRICSCGLLVPEDIDDVLTVRGHLEIGTTSFRSSVRPPKQPGAPASSAGIAR